MVILLIVSNASGKGLYSPSLLIEGIKHKFTTKIGGEAVFCYTGTGNTTEPSYLFNEVLIHVNETNGKKIPWYSVKGVSTDDLHMHLENMVYYIMEQAGFQTDHEIKAPYEVESYIRDAVSACPNPLFSSSRSECVMRFSSVGQACVRITSAQEAKELLHFVVYVEEKLNMNFVYRFLFGATAFFIAGRLGYNMLFQVQKVTSP